MVRRSKPRSKAKARPQRTPAKAARRPTRPTSKPSARPAQAKTKAAPASPLAERMAAFSQRVLGEEETPVAVRSWSEAKAGSAGSKEYVHKTGTVRRVAPGPPVTEEEQAGEGEERPEPAGEEEAAPEPRAEPLAGPAAVPRDEEEAFDVAKDAKHRAPGKRKRGVRPEEFGLVELRQATATGGRHLTRSKPENLQRGAGRIQPLASAEEAGRAKKPVKVERFEVAMDAPEGTVPSPRDLSDFGEVEIGQQTRSGSRKVGTLPPSEGPEASGSSKKPRKPDEGA